MTSRESYLAALRVVLQETAKIVSRQPSPYSESRAPKRESRVRRADAKALSAVAARLALDGRDADAKALALIAVRLAKLAGSHEALVIATAVLDGGET